jgi:ABC-type sugar transport system substrate-binding protein
LFTPSDNKAIEPALAEAKAAGIPTIMGTSAFIPDPNITATVTVELFTYYAESAARLFQAMGGSGEVAMLRTIAGTTEDTIQDQAVNCVLKAYPGIKIVASEFATYGTPQAQKAAEAWAVRFPNLKGILSVYAETSIGAFNAMNAAGRANQVEFSPGNAQNGWLKVIQKNPAANLGGVEYPVTTSKDTVEVIAKILSGEAVPQATLLGGEYIEPEAYAAQVEPDKPDTWWPNDLPAEFLPKS